MGGWVDGWMDGRADRQTDRQTDSRQAVGKRSIDALQHPDAMSELL